MDPIYSAYVPVTVSPTQESIVAQVAQNSDNWAVFFDARLARGTFVARLYAINAGIAPTLVGQITLGAGVVGQANIEIVRSPIKPGTIFSVDEPGAAGAAAYELRLFSVDATGTITARLAGYSYTANAADAQNGSTQNIPSGSAVTFGTLTGQFQFLDAYVDAGSANTITHWRILARGGPGGPIVAVDFVDLPQGFRGAIFSDLTKIGGDQYFLEGSAPSGGSVLSVKAVLAGRTSALITASTSGGSTILVEDEGVPIAGNPFTTVNFVGAGISAAPGAPNTVDVTVPGGGGVVLAGDATGPSAANTVVAIQNTAVPAGPYTTGNVLQALGAAFTFAAINLAGGANFVTGVLPAANQAPQALAGDVSGTTAANVVNRINGATVPAAGALTTGNVLQVTGVSSLGYAPVNLAGGANFVTGILPAANQAPQTLAGDATGTTAAVVVVRINGATVPVAGALTPGDVLTVSGVSSLAYVTPAASSIGVQDEGVPLVAPITTLNFVGAGVTATGGPGTATITIPGGGVVALAGDVTGTSAASTVVAIQNTAVPAGPYTTGNVLQASGAAFTMAPINLAGGANFVTGVLPAANQAAQTLTGDVSGTTAANVVDRIHGATVPIAGALTTGNVLQVTGVSTLSYAPINLAGGANFVSGLLPNVNQQSQVMGGDVTGTTAASVVARINGATVPAAGALTTGNVLQVTGVSALSYAAVNLAGGANFVTGVLPTANQAPQALAGDATGTTAAVVVTRINGATVPAAGALTTGNVLQVTGVSALSYAPINLAGGANFVTGVLPTANQAAQSLSGDVTGTTAASIVQTLTGTASAVTIPAATSLRFGAAPASVGFLRFSNNTSQCWRNAANTGDVVALTVDAANIVIVGSGGQTNTARVTCIDGAANVLEWECAATGVNGRRAGSLFFQHSSAGLTTINSLSGQAITFSASSGTYNYGGPGTMTVNYNVTTNLNVVVGSAATGPTWTQTAGAAAGVNTTFRAQGAGGANNAGGRWDLQGGARTGTGLKGGVTLGLNGTTETLVEIVEVAAGRRAVVLNRAALITTTQLPANSGDLVTYMGDAATVPTADSVTGCLLYSNTSVFSFRNGAANGGNRIEWTIVSSATATQGAAAIPALAQEFMDLQYNGNARKIALFLP